MVELHDERDPVRVLPRHRAQHAQRRRHRVAAARERQLHDVLGIEVGGVRRKRRARRVLDALVDGQDRNVARARQATSTEQRLQIAHHARRAVGQREDPIHEIGTGKMQVTLRDRLALVRKQLFVAAERRFNLLEIHASILPSGKQREM